MPLPHDSDQHQALSGRKASVLQPSASRQPGRSKFYVLSACVALILAAAGFFYTQSQPRNAITIASVTPVNGEILHPLAAFADGVARHFVMKTANGAGIRYFVLQTPDGMIRTAFDACDVCWKANKGYVQVGDEMICRNCSMRFASSRIGELQGGCNPAPLPGRQRDGQLVILVDDVLHGLGFFDFSRKEARG